MSARDFESFLTRIYMDSRARTAFKADPRGEALRAGLSQEECTSLEKMDWIGLEMAARSFAQKRRSRIVPNRPWTFFRRARQFVSAIWQWLRFH